MGRGRRQLAGLGVALAAMSLLLALNPSAARTSPIVAPNAVSPPAAIRLSGIPIAVRSGRVLHLWAVVDSLTVEGTSCASIVLSRLEHAKWVPRQTVAVALASQTSTRTVLTSAFQTVSRGRWSARLRLASTASSDTTVSRPVTFIVVGPRWVALTFDGGPWPSCTDGMLRVLRKRDVRATFFMIGAHLKLHPAIARRVAAAGHQLGNHTWRHPDLTRCSNARIRKELSSTSARIRKTCGITPRVFRPPYGNTNRRVARVAASLGLRQVRWTADSADWLYPAPSAIRKRVLKRVKPGGVVLMHDGGGNRATTVRALPGIIDTLRHRGYYFVTMDEWQLLRSTR